MEKLKVLELFSGIGACSKALERLGIDFEIVDSVEIDKYAVKSFNAIHNTNFEPQDICKWDKDIEVDLIMHGSPCVDFSLAGKQAGGDKDSGTRSSLMYETIRIVEKLKPKYVVWENVKNLLSKRHRHNFDAYLEIMESLGYTNYYQVLNAKDYGIPQNRERVFTISIFNDAKFEFPKENIENCEIINPLKGTSGKSWQFEQNVYSENSILRSLKAGGGSGNIPKVIENFTFPPKQELKLKLKDILEDNVDEKYYLSDEQVNKIKYKLNEEKGFVQNKYEKFIEEKGYIPEMFNPYNEKEIKDIAPTQSTYCGSMTSSATVLIKNNTKQGYLEATDGDGCYIQNIDRKRGTVQKEMIPTLKTSPDIGCVVSDTIIREEPLDKPGWHRNAKEVLNVNGISSTIVAQSNNLITKIKEPINLRIRKLTPKECWRLMGFDDEDFEKAEKVNSNTQLYKQAGNSIVVNVLEAIFKNLLKDYLWSDLD